MLIKSQMSMEKADPFLEVYLHILNEDKSPTTFTPEELLYSIRESIFYSNGNYAFYTVEDLEKFTDDKNKDLFKVLVKHMKDKNDFGMMLLYFNSVDDIEKIIMQKGYSYPPMPYKNVPKNFSMTKAFEHLENFFKDSSKRGANFNSIDICPELGCIIAVNGAQLLTDRDFEQVLDHEINHYFEQMKIHFKDARRSELVELNEDVINELADFYSISIEKKSFINDLKTHLFHEDEFRSMSANVFHEILRYNKTHLKQLSADEVFDAIKSRQWRRFEDVRFQEALLFAWVCRSLSSSRWMILRARIIEACSVKKNIFQKFFIAGKDGFRNLIMRFKKL